MKLRTKLVAAIVPAIVAIAAIGTAAEYRSSRKEHLAHAYASLREQAYALKSARQRMSDPTAFESHVEEVCQAMNNTISPGHHFLVLDPGGRVAAKSQHHSGSSLNAALLSTNDSEGILKLAGRAAIQTRITDEQGYTYIMSQYTDHLESVLGQELVGRIATEAVAVLAIIAVVFLAESHWVLKPFTRLARAAKQWARRDFAARVDLSGPKDVRELMAEFNTMAGELDGHEKQRTGELERARRIQAHLLPAVSPFVPGLKVTANYHPSAHVAGDLYDTFTLPGGQHGIAVIDVAGHGIGAALLTGLVRMAIRYRLFETSDPGKAMIAINEDVREAVPDGQFVTACIGVWNPSESTWSYAAAGQSGGIVLAGGEARCLDATGPLLGIASTGSWDVQTVKLAQSDRLFLFTDGIIEAAAPDRHLGLKGLADVIQTTSANDLHDQVAIIMEIYHDLVARVPGHHRDDMTLVALEAGVVRVEPPVSLEYAGVPCRGNAL